MNTYVRRDFYLSAFAGIAIGLVQVSLLVLGVMFILFLVGCQPVEKDVRDALAANKGYLVAAIQKHSVECMSNRNISVCEIIVKDAHAQGAAVTAFESYCQIPAHTMDDPSLKCKPVRSLSGALTSALKNLNALSADIKAAAQ